MRAILWPNYKTVLSSVRSLVRTVSFPVLHLEGHSSYETPVPDIPVPDPAMEEIYEELSMLQGGYEPALGGIEIPGQDLNAYSWPGGSSLNGFGGSSIGLDPMLDAVEPDLATLEINAAIQEITAEPAEGGTRLEFPEPLDDLNGNPTLDAYLQSPSEPIGEVVNDHNLSVEPGSMTRGSLEALLEDPLADPLQLEQPLPGDPLSELLFPPGPF